MDRVLDGFTTCLNFRLSDRAPPDKIALAEGGTVLCVDRTSLKKHGPSLGKCYFVGRGAVAKPEIQTRSKAVEHTVHGGAKRPIIC